eukprot:TRINITY_DN14214_c0_g1_i1.p1 TRINITY_DN14214_c0_g1~~TRINITY_DN14214_c0_g1_i1.p1  ORF type:complete len:83 (+),score=20.36 TRINITY_DN14214_c0_g1_i1:30-278(+)
MSTDPQNENNTATTETTTSFQEEPVSITTSTVVESEPRDEDLEEQIKKISGKFGTLQPKSKAVFLRKNVTRFDSADYFSNKK